MAKTARPAAHAGIQRAAVAAGLVALPAALALVASLAWGQAPPAGTGPWDNDLTLYESPDGLAFAAPRRLVERGGVPTLVRDPRGRLVAAFQWFPFDRAEAFDRVASVLSEDEGKTWSAPQPILIQEIPEYLERPYDPTLTLLEDGRIRIYFTSSDTRRADRSTGQATYSAVGTDGSTYRFEPGVRFAVAGERVIDCAVVRWGPTWHYYAPVQGAPGRGYHAVSEDGLSFRRLDDVSVPGERSWLGCVVVEGERLRFYGTGLGGWTALSADGASWRLDERVRTGGVDPGVARLRNGRRFMLSTGPRRADAGTRLPPGMEALPGGPGSGGGTGTDANIGAGSGPGVVAAGAGRLFLLLGNTLYAIDPATLRIVARRELPHEPAAGGPAPQPAERGMAGAGGAADPNGPYYHRLLSATSRDGLTWQRDGQVLREHASGPDAAVGPDGAVRIYFVDGERSAIGLGIERPGGRWEWFATNLRGADPNLLLLPDGTWRVYLKLGREHGRIACTESSDGVTFGTPRPVFEDARYPALTDPDVLVTPTGWLLYVSLGPQLLRAVSPDGGTFTAERTLDLGGAVGDTVEVPGGYRMYFHCNPAGGERLRIASAFSRDGREWQAEGIRLRASADGPDRGGVGDPAVVRLPDGTWRMFYKSFVK
ncbi:MAG: exo-alpha-sialidase [Planctomycetes bacterium]|nr:exo-alpha-sialidase [Planctomycetota bacterium]